MFLVGRNIEIKYMSPTVCKGKRQQKSLNNLELRAQSDSDG